MITTLRERREIAHQFRQARLRQQIHRKLHTLQQERKTYGPGLTHVGEVPAMLKQNHRSQWQLDKYGRPSWRVTIGAYPNDT